jgi:hypothetical protein
MESGCRNLRIGYCEDFVFQANCLRISKFIVWYLYQGVFMTDQKMNGDNQRTPLVTYAVQCVSYTLYCLISIRGSFRSGFIH